MPNVILEELARLAEVRTRRNTPPVTPPLAGRGRRKIKQERNIVPTARPSGDLATIRAEVAAAIEEYIELDQPVHALLLSLPPGGGKTYAGVRAAERAALAGERVLYAGPRTDFFNDVIAVAQHPDLWYQWLPRQQANEDKGQIETCRYAPQINSWMVRGWDAMDFCAQHCGWDYINDGCRYHAQKEESAPIIFGQHAHVTLGHPLKFNILIGDENPIGAIIDHPWATHGIPGRFIAPTGMDVTEPMTAILHQLASLAASLKIYDGPGLMEEIGGAEAVLEACNRFSVAIGDELIAPYLRHPADVENAPYGHLPTLLYWLRREAEQALAGEPYEPRVVIATGKLFLVIRQPINAELPARKIWLDATANSYLYERMTGWTVEHINPHIKLAGPVMQVYDTSNNKSSLVTKTESKDEAPASKEANPKAYRARLQVDQIIKQHGYKRPLIASYLDLGKHFEGYQFVHFYGQRGTNRYEDCDAIIVLGTPQPSAMALVKQGKQLFPERRDVFRAEWQERDVLFAQVDENGNGFSFPASGFWADEDLQALLWQVREAEIIQTAHRVRPILSPKPIWLLTNLPISDLPPTRLLTVRELFEAPAGVDPYLWTTFIELADLAHDEDRPITAKFISEMLGLSKLHANRYLDLLMAQQPDRWELGAVPRSGAGRPPKAAQPLQK